MKDKEKKYDCRICHYAAYKDDRRVFCSFCMRLILERKPQERLEEVVNG